METSIECFSPQGKFKLHQDGETIFEKNNYKCCPDINDIFNEPERRQTLHKIFNFSTPIKNDQQELRRTSFPVMGKSALLYKAEPESPTPTEGKEEEDSRIIHELVMDKYYDNLADKYRKSFIRHQQKSFNFIGIDEDIENDDMDSSNIDPNLSKKVNVNSLSESKAKELESFAFEMRKSLKRSSTKKPPSWYDEVVSDINTSCEKTINSSDENLEDNPNDSNNNFSRNTSRFASNRSKVYTIKEIDDKREELKLELAIQKNLILQTIRAIQFCKSMNLTNEKQIVEAERILLLTTFKAEAIENEINNLINPNLARKENLGCLEISNLEFPCEKDYLSSEEFSKRIRKGIKEHFVCILSYKDDVRVTDIFTINDECTIRFNQSFTFEDLPLDFEIKILICSMKTRPYKKSKWQIFKGRDENNQSTLGSFFRLGRKISRVVKAEDVKTSLPEFSICGSAYIRIEDIRSREQSLMNITSTSLPKGVFLRHLTTSVKPTNETLSGFLDIGQRYGECIVWNRCWCTLEGFDIKYWKFPGHQYIFDAATRIDLRNISSGVVPASRQLCPRPRTLLLDVEDSDSFERYFLSAATLEEMKTWEKKINTLIRILEKWDCLNHW